MDNSKATPSKDTGAKNTNSDSVGNYRHEPKVEIPNPKATKNKSNSSGIRGV